MGFQGGLELVGLGRGVWSERWFSLLRLRGACRGVDLWGLQGLEFRDRVGV